MKASSATTFLVFFCAVGTLQGTRCPGDSLPDGKGGCNCKSACPAHECRSGERQVLVRPAAPETPGKCCPEYDCVSTGLHTSESCPDDSVATDDGGCKCIGICPPPTCLSGQRLVQVKQAVPETPGSCCPLYECVPSESVSWVETEEGGPPSNCIYEGISKRLGERWKPSNCKSCVCEESGVSCQIPMCKSCENSLPPGPGECCPHCPPFTNTSVIRSGPCPPLDDCDLRCDYGYVNDDDMCPTCKCAGTKDIDDKDVVGAPDGELPGGICPELTHCGLDCDLVKDDGGCSICACQERHTPASANDSDVLYDENGKRVCPEVKCDLHCERGLVMDDNDCTFCECKPPYAGCPELVGCKKKCLFGFKTNKRGCPICRCRATCMDHLNQTHPEGSIWHPNACKTCTCEAGGRLNCNETVCSVACSNPLPPKPGTCCPYCPIPQVPRGWGTVPITLIVVLALLCLLLIVHIVRNRFRGRLSPSEASYSSYPPQYYKCVPAYDTPVHRTEKIVPL